MSADEECRIKEVQYKGGPLDEIRGEYPIPSFSGRLSIVFMNGEQEEYPLFEGKPLTFKLRNNWTGDGHRSAKMTNGHFIVIAPKQWARTGHIPVEPEVCTDSCFSAHYFFRDGGGPSEDIGGFQECDVALTASGFKLTGERVFDDSEDGKLFVGDVPELKASLGVIWARVGEEKKNGWKGVNFKPEKQSLAGALSERQGRFFIRVYDGETKLQDSGQFRYLRNLKEIRVNGESYTEQTLFAPSPTGHPSTKLRFVGRDDACVFPALPVESRYAVAEDGGLLLKPHPDGDTISCRLESDSGRVDIELKLPRIWWRMERGGSESGEWCDTPLTMTRIEFRKYAQANAALRLLHLPKRIKSVAVGFNDELERKYGRESMKNDSPSPQTSQQGKGKAGFLLPLADFVDYSQVDQQLNEDTSFNVKCWGAVLTLIRISADPVPAIVSFSCKPQMVAAGEQVTLRWRTLNTEADGVAINPEIGAVETSGQLEVVLFKTMNYTLRLKASGTDDVTETVTVTVRPPPQAVEKPIALIRRAGGGRWKHGKGFSYSEIRAAGMTVAEAKHRSMRIDKRRRSEHQTNMETIRRWIDV